MLTASELHGILPAIPTPVTADDAINVPATRALIAYLLEQGVDGLVPLGGTGESGALSRSERLKRHA